MTIKKVRNRKYHWTKLIIFLTLIERISSIFIDYILTIKCSLRTLFYIASMLNNIMLHFTIIFSYYNITSSFNIWVFVVLSPLSIAREVEEDLMLINLRYSFSTSIYSRNLKNGWILSFHWKISLNRSLISIPL